MKRDFDWPLVTQPCSSEMSKAPAKMEMLFKPTAAQAESRRGPKKTNRALEVQGYFKPASAPYNIAEQLAAANAPLEISKKVQEAVKQAERNDYEKSIREYQIPLSSIPIPKKEEVFTNSAVLEPLLLVLLDEDYYVRQVVQGLLPIETYATARELAKIVQKNWPAEMHQALQLYQQHRLSRRK